MSEHIQSGMSRRDFIGSAATLAAGFVLGGCAAPTSTGASTGSEAPAPSPAEEPNGGSEQAVSSTQATTTGTRLPEGYEKIEDDPRIDEGSYDASGFAYVTDAAPDVILEARYFSTFNFVGERIDGYLDPSALLTKEAAEALAVASSLAIERGYRLKLWDAYRPQRGVNHFERWALDLDDTRMKQYFYPDLNKDVLFDQGYIDHYSGHTRGSTVDLTLFSMEKGADEDMGGTFDLFSERSHPTYTAGITDEQYQHRMVLRDIMTQAGFNPLPTEWWHFILSDEPYPNTFFDFPVWEDLF